MTTSTLESPRGVPVADPAARDRSRVAVPGRLAAPTVAVRRITGPAWLRGGIAALHALAAYLAVSLVLGAAGLGDRLGDAPGAALVLAVVAGCSAAGVVGFGVIRRRLAWADPAFRVLAAAALVTLVVIFAASPRWSTLAAILSVLASVGSLGADSVRSGRVSAERRRGDRRSGPPSRRG